MASARAQVRQDSCPLVETTTPEPAPLPEPLPDEEEAPDEMKTGIAEATASRLPEPVRRTRLDPAPSLV